MTAPTLRKVAFKRELLPRVENFFCGSDSRWEIEAAAWIKAATADKPYDCAVLAVERCETKVWLYETDDKQIVGFTSLAKSAWKIPPPNGPKLQIAMIPWIAIQKQFWGKPDGAANSDRYSSQLIADVIYEAHQIVATLDSPHLGLCVEPTNIRAIAAYAKHRFVTVEGQYIDKATRVKYDRMLLELPPAATPTS